MPGWHAGPGTLAAGVLRISIHMEQGRGLTAELLKEGSHIPPVNLLVDVGNIHGARAALDLQTQT
jgi:hypothetical protein